jgi:hypothetical protein
MDKLLYGEIIPGERIGIFHLGWKSETLKKHLSNNYKLEERVDKYIIIEKNIKFWIDKKSDIITQISVFGCFKGKFQKDIGIGSTLFDVQKGIGPWKEQYGVYILHEYPGICFELLDEDDWNELQSPIEFISIYKNTSSV